METIVACRSQISDRFPVASFAISVPPTRYYEVACATDPRLFHSQHRRNRTRANFFSSREHGLLRAERGDTAWMLPPEQLQRFAGARRVFYALGSYGSPRGDDAHFTIAPTTLDQVPSIGLAADFTGRSLDRTRIGQPRPSASDYGGDGPDLAWGGDLALDAETRRAQAAQDAPTDSYDDGHDKALWDQAAGTSAGTGASGEPTDDPDQLTDHPPVALAIAAEAAAGCDDTPADLIGGVTASVYGGWSDQGRALARDDEDDDDEEAEGLSAAAIDDGDDAEDTQYGGFEDGAAIYGAAQAVTKGTPEGVPYGDDSHYGGSGVAVLDEPETSSPEVTEGLGEVSGRDPGYRFEDEPDLAESHSAIELGVRPLDIPEKVRLLRVVARAESGRDGYTAINPDNEYRDPSHPAHNRYHIGLSWGFIQFTQRSGALGQVLRAAERRARQAASLPAAERFETLFGPDWSQLLAVTNASTPDARVEPVGGQVLWDRVWTDRFRAAGNVGYITAAQNEIAVSTFVDPLLAAAGWLGFTTPRSLSLLIDRVIHMGPGGGLSWVMSACGPLTGEPQWRAALEALGIPDLASFQRSKAPHLSPDNRFGPKTHAALVGALRRLGSRSPVAIPDRDAMLRRLVSAAQNRRFAARVRALYDNRTDFDDSVSYDLAQV